MAMVIYSVRGPDGRIYDVKGPEGASEQEVIAAVQQQLGGGRGGKEQAGFVESFKEAATTLGAAPAAARFAAAQTPEEQRAAREELLASTQSPYAKTSWADVKDIPSAIDWAKQLAGSSAGALAAPAVAGLATGPIGGIAALGSQYTTSNLVRQAEEQKAAEEEGRVAEETSVGKALVGAAGSTALDYAGFKFFGPLFRSFPAVGKLFGEEGEKAAKETAEQIADAVKNKNFKVTDGVWRGIGKGAAFEVPQEIAQQALERWQAGLSLTDADARSEYYEAAAGAVLLGGALGGAEGVVSNSKTRAEARRILEEKDAQDAAKRQQEAEATQQVKEGKKKEEAPAPAVDVPEGAVFEPVPPAATAETAATAEPVVTPPAAPAPVGTQEAAKQDVEQRAKEAETVKQEVEGKVEPVEPAPTITETAAAAAAAPTEVAGAEPRARVTPTETVTPAVGGSPDVSVSGQPAAGQVAEGTEGAGVVTPTVSTKPADVRKEVFKPTLDLRNNLSTLNDRVNTVKQYMREGMNEGVVNSILKMSDDVQSLIKKAEKLPAKDTERAAGIRQEIEEKVGKVESSLDTYENFLLPKDLGRAPTEAETRQSEAAALERAQKDMAERTGKDIISYDKEEFANLVDTKDVGGILNYIKGKAADVIQAAKEEALLAAERRGESATKRKKKKEGIPAEERTARKQNYKQIEKAQEALQDREVARLNELIPEVVGARHEVSQALADSLSQTDFSDMQMNVEGTEDADTAVIDRLKKEGKFAEYDPKTNIFHLTKKGATPKIVMHELVHAVTVRILKQFTVDPSQLTEDQREAAEHINKIYELAKKRIGRQFPNAFENVYEFASYAMTEPAFQQRLAAIRSPSLAKYTKAVQSLWEQLSDALMRLYKLATPEQLNKKNAVSRIGRVEAARRDPYGNLLLETAGAFTNIITPPKKGVEVEPLAARKRGVRKIARTQSRTLDEIFQDNEKVIEKQHPKSYGWKAIKNLFGGYDGYENLVRVMQNDRRPIVTLQRLLSRAGKLVSTGDKANNIDTAIALSSGRAYHNLMAFLKTDMDSATDAVSKFAKIMNLDERQALARLDRLLVGMHERERRAVKYLLNVPLNNTTKIKLAGIEDTAAGWRERLVKELYESKDMVSNGKAKQYRSLIESLVKNYADRNGSSPTDAKPGTMPIDMDADEYSVLGTMDKNEVKLLQDEYERLSKDSQVGPILKQLSDSLNKLKDSSKNLDREANYWTQPVDNIVAFYGFENYVPLKGKGGTEVSKDDDRFEIGKRLGGEYVETANAFEGRKTDADNVITQILSDGVRSAMRAGRSDVTQTIKNLLKEGYISGRKQPIKVIKFNERYKGIVDFKKEKGESKIFHYMPNGDIEIYKINDKKMLEAIRRSYKDSNPLIEVANQITSGIGHMHTRYNPAFYPYNFVRDVLTNAFTMGAELGPKATGEYISAVAKNVKDIGFRKSFLVSKMYNKGDIEGIKKYGGYDPVRKIWRDPFVRDVYEYLEPGGRVSYIQGIATQGKMEKVLKDFEKNKFVQNRETLNNYLDAWADSFELTSRAAAYSVAKNNALAKGLSEEAAKKEAAAYAKNLANFEQVGQWGKEAGALFMFFRPAATGAVRAIDSIAPLLQDTDAMVRRLPESIQNDPAAVAEFRKNHMEAQKNAKNMLIGVAGAGATLYMMAMMAADDDELGRNKVATDDMALWTRNIRLPLGFMGGEGFLQLPWGFGIGAFGAAGAQLAGAAFGKSSLKDATVNMISIGLDSFVPLPISRIDPTKNPTAFIVDSIVPSAVRPFVEFTMNVDSLGREIYNNRMTKYGDAYTGGMNVPEAFKSASDLLFRATNGDIQVQPSTLNFWANNYVDGVSRIGQSAIGIGMWVTGSKDFDAKSDLAPLSSFLGRKSNYDGREFAKMEDVIKKKAETLNALKNLAARGDTAQYYRYMERNPNDEAIVYIYNKQINGTLRQLRAARNALQSDTRYTPKEKKPYLDELNLQQNYLKRGMIETFKQYGVNP